MLLAGIVVLAVAHYATLLGTGPGSPATWALPVGVRRRRGHRAGLGGDLAGPPPGVYATIGLGAHAITGQRAPAASEAA